MTSARKLKSAPASRADVDTFRALETRLLKGAAERIHADVQEALRRGLIDAKGRRIPRKLPEDMLSGAKRDFGG
jgi:hypothetical protein